MKTKQSVIMNFFEYHFREILNEYDLVKDEHVIITRGSKLFSVEYYLKKSKTNRVISNIEKFRNDYIKHFYAILINHESDKILLHGDERLFNNLLRKIKIENIFYEKI